jgi:hypothetical protein
MTFETHPVMLADEDIDGDDMYERPQSPSASIEGMDVDVDDAMMMMMAPIGNDHAVQVAHKHEHSCSTTHHQREPRRSARNQKRDREEDE